MKTMDAPANHGSWIQTYTGKKFYPLDPRPEDIDIKDIAHALSLQCRFTGPVKTFYSVAEHSIGVSKLCPPEYALWGLLHDASEAYISDVARPVKHQPTMNEYRVAEARLQTAIVKKYGLPGIEPPEVKAADQVMLGIEARDLLGPLLPGWEKWLDNIPHPAQYNVAVPLQWYQAEADFLYRFWYLLDKQDRLRIAA